MTTDERIHEILYSTDSREELASRIAELEEFAQDMFDFAELYDEEKGPDQWCEITERAEKLGIEVNRWR